MNRMGGTCSMQRQRALWREEAQERRGRSSTSNRSSRQSPSKNHRSSRHAVTSPVPDRCVGDLYPLDDVQGKGPKTLALLCVETICRSLVDMHGELPPGLPQDVVDDIVESLVEHSALNATTLGALKNCEIRSLRLVGCRGVTDQWLEPFSSNSKNWQALSSWIGDHMMEAPPSAQPPLHATLQDHDVASSCSRSTSSFVSAISKVDAETDVHHDDIGSAAFTGGPSTSTEGFMKMGDKLFYLPPSESSFDSLTLLDLRGSQRLTDKGLLQLPELPSLEVARLDGCHAIVGRGLLAFSASHRLHTLSLQNCRRLTDEALVNVSHLVSLEALNLEGCRCLTDRALASIAGNFRLRKLDLSQCDLISDAGLGNLEGNEALEEVSLGWCRGITNRGIAVFTSHPGRAERIRILHLARCLVTDEGVEYLGRLVSLIELNLNGCSRIGSHALARTLEKLQKLESLDISYCPSILRTSFQGKIQSLKRLELCYSGVQDVHLAKLSSLPELEELNLDSCPVGDAAMAHLADNNVTPNLKSLDLADTDVSDVSMAHVAKFRNLTRLSLFYCNIGNRGLEHIGKLTGLEVLNLDSREISDSGLSHLRNLSNLRSLDVFSGRVSDSGCSFISQIKSLEALELCGGGIGDLGCTLMAQLENLTSLNISQNERITNRGASSLASLKKLRALNLSHTRVNLSGHLRLPKSLESLALLGCPGIDDTKSISVLQSNLPSLKCLRLNPLSEEDGMMQGEADSDFLCVLRLQTLDPTIEGALSRRAASGLHNVDDVDVASEISTMDDRDVDDMENESFYSNLD